MLNDEQERKKRQIMGSRNLNTQAKLMITEPSQASLLHQYDYNNNQSELQILSPSQSALRYSSFKNKRNGANGSEGGPGGKLTTLPLLTSPSSALMAADSAALLSPSVAGNVEVANTRAFEL